MNLGRPAVLGSRAARARQRARAAHDRDDGGRTAARQHGVADPFAPNGWAAIGTAAAVLVWGFAGWEAVASLAGTTATRAGTCRVPRASPWSSSACSTSGSPRPACSCSGPRPAAARRRSRTSWPSAWASRPGSSPPSSAVLLTLGAMNAYFAGGSRLGAALARDGALPRMLARGGDAGQVPRRSIALVTVASAALARGSPSCCGLGLTPLMLLATGCFTLVYVLGTASALRLLPRGTVAWWTALVAFVSVAALLVVNGVHALWALGLAVLSLGYRSGVRGWEGVPAQAPRLRRRDDDTTRGAHTTDAVVPGRRGDRPGRVLRARERGQGPAARPALVARHVPDRRRLLLHARLPARHRRAGRRRPVPVATLVLVLVTLFGALPMYRRVAGGEPARRRLASSMLERLLS